MILSLLAFLAAVACVNWAANPFGAWGSSFLHKIYLQADHESLRMTIPFRLWAEAPRTLLVGSSRILYGMSIEQGYRDGVLNTGLPGATLDEMDAVVRIATRSPELRQIIWGVDFYAFSERFAQSGDPQTQLRFRRDIRLLITETLLSLQALDASRKVLRRAVGGRERLPPFRVLPLPLPEGAVRESLEQAEPQDRNWTVRADLPRHLTNWLTVYSDYRPSLKLLAVFRNTVIRARDAGVRVTLFIPPMSEYELEAIRQVGEWDTFQHWKRQLLEAGSYWDFSGYHWLAGTDRMFMDVQHFAPAVGHTILRHLMGEACRGCGPIAGEIIAVGRRVDAANVEEHLGRQDAAMRRRTREGSPYARAVEHLIRVDAAPGRSQPRSRGTARPSGGESDMPKTAQRDPIGRPGWDLP
jgi:hypothetical protein